MSSEQQLENFRHYIEEHNMLMGTQVALYLGYEHAVFHDKLYQLVQRQDDAPKIYGFDGNHYILAVDPFNNPIQGMEMFGTATYGLEKKDIPLLLEVFPQKKEQIKALQDCFQSNRQV
ncbi:MAG: hypothetical protein MJZ79_07000 [Paludibacteraceae bacterium]|nr:hypothetical protein [Paludibacteraceae bacterium]